MTGLQSKQFLCQKNYSNVARYLCVSIFMIFTCYPIIFLCFRQFTAFSLLTSFAIHIGNPGIHEWRHFFGKGQTSVQSGLLTSSVNT
jgi:hypothetical protein